jgi:hypothetical protein
MASGKLIFAAGGNTGDPFWPAWQPGVIAVGASREGRPTEYSVHFPDSGKPDIFAPESLLGTALAGWVRDPNHKGTSFSALYAAAVAALVWANYRNLSAAEVRRILIPSSVGAALAGGGLVALDVQSALERMAGLKIRDLLETDDMEPMRLASESGLPTGLMTRALDQMVRQGTLETVADENGKLYRFPARIEARYAEVRAQTPSTERTLVQEALMHDARDVARRRGLSAADARVLWASDQLGTRILALASVYEHPEAETIDIVLDGIAHSRSAFEQFHAMVLADNMIAMLTPNQKIELRSMLESPQTRAWVQDDTDRRTLANTILSKLP